MVSQTQTKSMHNLGVTGQTVLLRDFFVDFQEPVWQNLATILKKDPSGEEFQLYWSVYEHNIFQQSWADVCTNRAVFVHILVSWALDPFKLDREI